MYMGAYEVKHLHTAKEHWAHSYARSDVAHGLRYFSTAAVLFHHAVAERLGLGPTDLQCLELLLERGAATASELAALTGLTSGALTGVVARLEAADFIERNADPSDGRRQTLQPRVSCLKALEVEFAPLHEDLHRMFAGHGAIGRRGIAAFLTEITALLYRHLMLLRVPPRVSSARSQAAPRQPRKRP